MNTLWSLLKNIRNLLPYLALVALYFFIVNIEAKKQKKIQKDIDKENILQGENTKSEAKKLRVTIPVIPYKQ